ncbi:hypothetical protein [Lacrimispora brassicae]
MDQLPELSELLKLSVLSELQIGLQCRNNQAVEPLNHSATGHFGRGKGSAIQTPEIEIKPAARK